MRSVVQRVAHARVRVAGESVGEIGPGLLALVGVARSDRAEDAIALADKLAGLRIFPDDDGKMNRSVLEAGGGVLVVSQFTLYGDVRRGRRPSFVEAAPPEMAAPLVETVAVRLAGAGLPVSTGSFGAMMEVDLVNDGPVTMIIETSGGKLV